MGKNTGKIHLSAAGEDYLEAMLILQNQKSVVRSVDIVDYFGVTRPTVSVAVHNLADAGYLSIKADKSLCLTKTGRTVAVNIYEKHCFFKNAFIQLGIDSDLAEAEACKIEHDISDISFSAIKAYCKSLCNKKKELHCQPPGT